MADHKPQNEPNLHRFDLVCLEQSFGGSGHFFLLEMIKQIVVLIVIRQHHFLHHCYELASALQWVPSNFLDICGNPHSFTLLLLYPILIVHVQLIKFSKDVVKVLLGSHLGEQVAI